MESLILYGVDGNAKDIPPPQPSSTLMPHYLKAMEHPSRGKPRFDQKGYVTNARACVPFSDALGAGWIQATWCDIHISVVGGEIRYNSSNDRSPILSHREMNAVMAEAWPDYLPVEFVWMSQWQPQAPQGFSLLITQPLNRPELPFHTTSGIIDADQFTVEGPGKIPFYIRKGFTGLIPAGTPMYQIIPIRREAWKRELRDHDDKRRPRTYSRLRRYFTGGYRREYWQRKEYR
jgi:hypothetical protein